MTTTEDETELPFLSGGPEEAFRVGAVHADGDTMRAQMRTGAWNLGPHGRPSFGSLGVLVDDMLGYAVIRSRPEGHWATSTEIHVEFSDHIPLDGAPVHAESQLVVLDPGSGLSEGRVFDERGRSIALCSQRLRFIPGTPAALGRPGRDAPAVPLREVGTVEQLHGGIMLCATEVAGHDAVRPEEGGLRTSAVHITYVRPGPLEGEVTFAARTVHRGRSLAVAQVISRNPAAKICSYATVTSHAP